MFFDNLVVNRSDVGNGDGNGDSHLRTPLEEVTDMLEARAAGEEPSSDDPVHRWKTGPATLDTLREGLIAVSQISEAAIEGGIKMAADLNKALPSVERNEAAINTIVARLESVTQFTHMVDTEVANMARMVGVACSDIATIKTDVQSMKGLLAEILARLPKTS